MAKKNTTKWQRYSSYKMHENVNGVAYVQPSQGAIALCYDPLQRGEKLLLELMPLLERSASADVLQRQKVAMEFVQRLGPTGIAQCRIDGPQTGADAESTGKNANPVPEVFAKEYAENLEEIAKIMEKMFEFFWDYTSNPELESLGGLAEILCPILRGVVQSGRLHQCAYCRKFYYSDDPNSRTCDDGCEFTLKINENINEIKHKYPCDVLLRG